MGCTKVKLVHKIRGFWVTPKKMGWKNFLNFLLSTKDVFVGCPKNKQLFAAVQTGCFGCLFCKNSVFLESNFLKIIKYYQIFGGNLYLEREGNYRRKTKSF